jgi:hypothetical protein
MANPCPSAPQIYFSFLKSISTKTILFKKMGQTFESDPVLPLIFEHFIQRN